MKEKRIIEKHYYHQARALLPSLTESKVQDLVQQCIQQDHEQIHYWLPAVQDYHQHCKLAMEECANQLPKLANDLLTEPGQKGMEDGTCCK